MKLKHVFITLGLAATMGFGFLTGFKSYNDVKKAEAANGTSWYLRGSMNSWTGNDNYKIVEGGEPLVIDLAANAEFKVVNNATSWDGVTELTTASGDAKDKGEITFSSGNNSKVVNAGKYAFSVVNGALFADYGEFYYSGTGNSWETDTSTTGNHPKIVLNGGASVFNLSTNEQFKLRNKYWDKGVFGYSNLADGDFYGSFSDASGNINCNIAGQYDVSVSMTNHTWTIRAYPHGVNPDQKLNVYVFDKYGTNLNSYHFAHIYNSQGQSTTWPGASMSTYEGTTHVYKVSYWVGMETVIFNNKHGEGNNEGTQSIAYTLSNVAGKCLVLDGSVTSGEWDDTLWIAPETAKFIENNMHFQNFAEDDQSDGTACKGNNGYYAKAKAAYQASSFASFREELCGLNFVVERLQAWARANGETFDPSNGTFSASNQTIAIIENNGETNTAIIIVVVSTLSLVALGGFFFIKRRKESK